MGCRGLGFRGDRSFNSLQSGAVQIEHLREEECKTAEAPWVGLVSKPRSKVFSGQAGSDSGGLWKHRTWHPMLFCSKDNKRAIKSQSVSGGFV